MPLAPGIPDDFYDEFAAWVRIEPAARSDDLARGIEARVADPLWMLARQWQTGEFLGEDAGSPIRAELTYSTQELLRLRLGSQSSTGALPDLPLEAAVEREPWRTDWRERVRIGQHMERLLRDALGAAAGPAIADLRSRYAIVAPDGAQVELDDATRRFLRLSAGRATDGIALLDAAGRRTPRPPTGVDTQAWSALLGTLRAWRAALGTEPDAPSPPAWRNEQLDYRFELDPPAPVTRLPRDRRPTRPRPAGTHLIAPDYRSGDLDWYSFSSLSSPRGVWRTSTRAVHPTRIAVGGTSPRWWAFEDAATDFGALDVATPDLAKLLLMEFVLAYGDDWFSIPLTARMGTLVRIDQLRVFDTFGTVPTPIDSVRSTTREAVGTARADDPLLRWEVFTISPHRAGDPAAEPLGDVLLIPPVCGRREESRPLEEVFILRDEGANRVWGVEHTVPNGLGRPIRGFDEQHARRERRRAELERAVADLEERLHADDLGEAERLALEQELAGARAELARLAPAPRSVAIPRFRLATTVPENWIPFEPVQAAGLLGLPHPSIRLRRARMLRNAADEEPEPIPARTRFLSLEAADPLLWLEEATVSRAGLHLQLTAQRARWIDGKTYVWLGRKVVVGRGEGASGLRFDVMTAEAS